MNMKTIKIWGFYLLLTLCCATTLTACSNSNHATDSKVLQKVNDTLRKMKADGTLRQLHEKYGLVYAY